MSQTSVTTHDQLLAAVSGGATDIHVKGSIESLPMITLPPGVCLSGGSLSFRGAGLRLTADNKISETRLVCPETETAISNDQSRPGLGHMVLRDMSVDGQVLLLAGGTVRDGHVHVENLTILSADVRARAERPHGYGVNALQGAFTLWNRHVDTDSVVSATLRGISVGSEGRPVRGSGVFVGGRGDRSGTPVGGRVEVDLLQTGTIIVDGGIAPGTADLISGGVFVQTGAVIRRVINAGPVTTLGANDMVLDNWGEVDEWTSQAAITSRGPSGIGFVNFGTLQKLTVAAPIETWGAGARGFNLYDGTLESATFDSVITHGDGAVGIQITKPLPDLTVENGIRTTGSEGVSLVRGKQVVLKATAFSLKPGGSLRRLRVGGGIATSGANVVSLEIGGDIESMSIEGGVTAHGQGSDTVRIHGDSKIIDGLGLVRAISEPTADNTLNPAFEGLPE
ncbi:hypothetical protein [Streptomyces sp. NPDC094468]|uniref:hypothetical protein n=1 Tax=Streptomyces sp. NPDC094468 TaxID=3366066 RepID=UPI0038098104